MPVIFISYRREDTAGHSGRLFDRLREQFGRDHVFLDMVGIEAGVDFVERIDKAIGSCDVLLAVIGREWLNCRDKEGRRRLDNPDDFIRAEISSALQGNVRVIPVLVEGAEMPSADALPEELKRLTRRHAVEIRDSRWDADIEALIAALRKEDSGGARRDQAPSVVPPTASGEPSREVKAVGRSDRQALLWGIGALVIVLLAAGAIRFFNRSQETEPKEQAVGMPQVSEPNPSTVSVPPKSGPESQTVGAPPKLKQESQTVSVPPGSEPEQQTSSIMSLAPDEESLPKLFVLAIGIDDYGHPASNRHSAVASAKAVASLFAKQKRRAFSDVETILLTESDATQANLSRALKSWARTASSKDLAVAFFSGRSGVFPTDNYPGRYAFMCFDSDHHEPERTGISGEMILDLSANIASPKLVIIDTPTYGGIHPQEARDATPTTEVKRLPALSIMLASWNGEDTETSFGQSSFSKALLDALETAADINHDDVVTFSELWDYMLVHGNGAALTTPLQFRELNSRTVLVRTSASR